MKKRYALLAGIIAFPALVLATTVGSGVSKLEDGLPLINPAVLNQLSGIRVIYPTRAAYDAAVTQERFNETNNGVNSGVWPSGQEMSITGELGVHLWFVGSTPANSHARNVSYIGRTYALAADSNVFGATSGPPASGTGANGDYMADVATGLVYGPKASGTWPVGIAATITTASLTAAVSLLPTTTPGSAGVLWLNSGVLTVSTGGGSANYVLNDATGNYMVNDATGNQVSNP